MIDKLEELYVKIDKDEFFGKYSGTNSIGRPHLAQELVAHGFADDFKTAFMKYLGDYKPAYVKKDNPDFKLVLNLIKSAGGVAIIAHPGKYIKHSVLQDFIGSGIDGLEVVHPSHKLNDSKYFSGVCQSHNLLTSGGSDFHGYLDADYTNMGNYFVSEGCVKAIENLHSTNIKNQDK